MDEVRRRAKLKEIEDLAQGSPEFEGGLSWASDDEVLIVGDWALFAIDDVGDLALAFNLDAHPLLVAKLTRFLIQHEVLFVLHEAFTVSEDGEVVFESDTGAEFDPDGKPPA